MGFSDAQYMRYYKALVIENRESSDRTHFKLKGDIVRQLSTKQNLKGIWFIEHSLGEVEHLEPYFAVEALVLEAFGKMYSNSGILVPSGLEICIDSSLELNQIKRDDIWRRLTSARVLLCWPEVK